MRIHLGKDRQAVQMMTATHMTVRGLTRRVKGVGHELYMDSSFSSPNVFDNLHTRGINCCGTVKKVVKECQGSLTVRHAH